MKLRRIVLLATVGLAIAWWLWPGGSVEVEPGSALLIDVQGEYLEQAEPSLMARLAGEPQRPLAGLLSEFTKAERDDRLSTVVLRIRSLQVGWAKAQEIRDAITRLGEKGRRTVAYLELETFGSNLEYYVASAAQELYVAPATRAPLVGLAGEYFFLGGFFEKLGVEIEVERIGRFKTAADTLAGREMSPAHREMADALLDSIDAQFVAGIAQGRGLSEAQVRAAIDAAPVEPTELQELALIDGVKSHPEVLEHLGDPPTIDAATFRGVEPASIGFEPEATFALVYGAGNVVGGRGSNSPSGGAVLASETISEALAEAASDPEISAIVFRINSPGGSALASDVVWLAAQRAQAEGKPLVASFSDVAASGGYYVAAGADAIVASPGSITGSIGVFVLRPVLGGLLEKLDIGVTSLTRGAHADLQLSSRTLSPGTRERLRREVESIYELFVERVAAGRPLDADEVDAVARGRVWTGAQAAEEGLVDELGGLRTAVTRAKVLAGLDPDADVLLRPYPRQRPVAEQLADLLRQASVVGGAHTPLVALGQRLEPWLTAAREGQVAALIPFSMEIR